MNVDWDASIYESVVKSPELPPLTGLHAPVAAELVEDEAASGLGGTALVTLLVAVGVVVLLLGIGTVVVLKKGA